jgi:hypothetical protein
MCGVGKRNTDISRGLAGECQAKSISSHEIRPGSSDDFQSFIACLSDWLSIASAYDLER